jgi:pimeloyl-[acyl-carrier protein] methyl ester esterase
MSSARLLAHAFGEGPQTVMWLHGWAMHCGVFTDVCGHLGKRFKHIWIDLPGHGRNHDSTVKMDVAEMAAACAAHLGNPVWLVGWSLGGLVAMALAAQYPQQVQGLVLLASTPKFMAGADWPHGMQESVLTKFQADLLANHTAAVERFLCLEAFGSDDYKNTLATLRKLAHAQSPPAETALRDGIALLRTNDRRSDLARIRCRSLWIAGARDRIVAPTAMCAAANMCENSVVIDLPGCGHAPFLTHPDTVAQKISTWMQATT